MPDITLEALYDDYARLCYWAAYGVLHDSELAHDAMQNAFLSAYRNMEALNTMVDAQRRAWLYRCAKNAGIDILRRNKRLIPTEHAGELEMDTAMGPEQEAERNETSRAIHEALAALPEKYREPLYLYYFMELGYREISSMLQLNEGTLKSRMARGRTMLENSLRKGGGLHA